MMAICDSKYRFIYTDIGHYGRDNDASIFTQSELYRIMNTQQADIPESDELHGKTTPYFFVGDEIFPLKPWLLKPYPGRNLTRTQAVYNYRFSRARRTIENAFGIMSARWRIFRRPIKASIDTIDLIANAAVCLHNYLLLTDTARYCPSGFVDSYNKDGLVEGDWRAEVQDGSAFDEMRLRSTNHTADAKEVRDHICDYVNSDTGAVSWQLDHVTSCGPRLSA